MAITPGGHGIRSRVRAAPQAHEASVQDETADPGLRETAFYEIGVEQDAVTSRFGDGQGSFDDVMGDDHNLSIPPSSQIRPPDRCRRGQTVPTARLGRNRI